MNKKLAKVVLSALLVVFLMPCAALAGEADSGAELASEDRYISVNETLSASGTNVFRFKLSQAGVISVTFGPDAQYDIGNTWSVRLVDDIEDDNYYNDANRSWSFKADAVQDLTTAHIGLPAGDFSIHVGSGNSLESYGYHFRVNYEARNDWESEGNDTSTYSDRVSLNTTMHGSLYGDQNFTTLDEDFYKFTLSEAGKVNIYFSSDYSDSEAAYSLTLYNKETDRLGTWIFRADSGEERYTYDIGLGTGNYYIEIEKSNTQFSGDYQFKVAFEARDDYETERNNGTNTADRVVFGQKYHGALTNSDQDYYKFTLSQDSNVVLTFGSDFADTENGWYIRFKNSSGSNTGNWMKYYESNGTDYSSTYTLSKGTYFLDVEAVSSKNISYRPYYFTLKLLNNYGFTDVSGDEWFATDDVLGYATEKGLISGYSNGAFGPYDDVTRAQVAMILWRMAGRPSASGEGFSDTSGHWAEQAILWARAEGVIGGYGNGAFGPDDPVTREQLCAMLERYARLVAGLGTSSDGARLSAMPDARFVSDWAYDAVAWCMDEGIVSGVSSGGSLYVQPSGTAQRCAAAKMFSVLDRDLL